MMQPAGEKCGKRFEFVGWGYFTCGKYKGHPGRHMSEDGSVLWRTGPRWERK